MGIFNFKRTSSEINELSVSDILNLWWQNKLSFSGRTTRKEYFIDCLTTVAVCLIVLLVSACVCRLLRVQFGVDGKLVGDIFIFIIVLDFLVLFILQSALSTRRMHDVGKSGWWQFAPFHYYTHFPSDDDNKYGPRPPYVIDVNESDTEQD